MKLDLGCGDKKKDSTYFGVDSRAVDGVDFVHDLRVMPWPWADSSVDEVHCSHFVEHLTGAERIPFFNELWRVMKHGGSALIVTPDWTHASAYGDPTHQWPPMSAWYAVYLNREWRETQAPHTPYNCDFTHQYGYTPDESLQGQSMDAIKQALKYNVNTARELRVTLTCRKQ
jgi:SAM-dependent methyltransferase